MRQQKSLTNNSTVNLWGCNVRVERERISNEPEPASKGNVYGVGKNISQSKEVITRGLAGSARIKFVSIYTFSRPPPLDVVFLWKCSSELHVSRKHLVVVVFLLISGLRVVPTEILRCRVCETVPLFPKFQIGNARLLETARNDEGKFSTRRTRDEVDAIKSLKLHCPEVAELAS